MRLPLLAVASLLCGASLEAQTLAFTANGTGARQDYRFSLGLFFDLNQPLTIAAVGYWDDNIDGVSSTLSVALFDRSGTPALVSGTQVDFSGSSGTLAGNLVANQDGSGRPGQFRLTNLPSAIVLPAGQYALVAWGFSFANEILNGYNLGVNPGPAVDVNTFGGVLTFVESRYGDNPGVLPTTLDHAYAQYAAATFSTTPVPEPAHVSLVAGAIALLGCLFAPQFRRFARKLTSL